MKRQKTLNILVLFLISIQFVVMIKLIFSGTKNECPEIDFSNNTSEINRNEINCINKVLEEMHKTDMELKKEIDKKQNK